jgi:hypothetical protein
LLQPVWFAGARGEKIKIHRLPMTKMQGNRRTSGQYKTLRGGNGKM